MTIEAMLSNVRYSIELIVIIFKVGRAVIIGSIFLLQGRFQNWPSGYNWIDIPSSGPIIWGFMALMYVIQCCQCDVAVLYCHKQVGG